MPPFRLALVAVVLIGCSSSPHPPADAIAALDDSGASVTAIAFPDTAIGDSRTIAVHLANRTASTTGAISFGTNGGFAIDSTVTTCSGAALEVDATCDIGVAFRPGAEGAVTGTLVIATEHAGSLAIALMGSGFAPMLQLAPATLDFGAVDIASSATAVIHVTNTSSAAAPLQSLAVTGAGFAQVMTTCGAVLAGNASCDVTVSFTPSALGAATGALTVTSTGHDYAASLAGTGARELAVVRGGSGDGTVTSAPAGIACGTTCTAAFSTDVVLTAVAAAGSVFVGWSDPSCTTATCTIAAATSAQTIVATFVPDNSGVSLTPVSMDWGLTAGGTRSFLLANAGASAVAIDSFAATGRFQVATATCGIALPPAASCTIDVLYTPNGTLMQDSGTLDVTVDGQLFSSQLTATSAAPVSVTVQGPGTVTSSPAGIDCGTTCSALFNQPVTLTAVPDSGNVLLGWSDTSCLGTSCVVQPGGSIIAYFGAPGTVSVTVQGPGTVTSSPAGIDCGTTCSAVFGQFVTLTAMPDSGNQLLGWSGACSGSGPTCAVQPGASVTAYFGSSTSLTVNFAGGGPGMVQVVDILQNRQLALCTSSCSVTVTPGAEINVTAVTPSNFGGLSGACSPSTSPPNNTSCSLIVDLPATITATFTKDPAERWTLLSSTTDPIVGGAFDGSGNFTLIQAHMITKLDATGGVLWADAVAADGFVAAPGGTLYVTSGGNLLAIDASGAITATNPFTGILGFIAPNGDLFGTDSNGVSTEWTPTGAVVRTLSFVPAGIDSSSTFYAVTSLWGAARWAFDGTPLSDFPEIFPSGTLGNIGGYGFVIKDDHVIGDVAPDHGSGYCGWESHAPDDSVEVSITCQQSSFGPGVLPVAATASGPDEVVGWYSWGVSGAHGFFGATLEWSIRGANGWTSTTAVRSPFNTETDTIGFSPSMIVGGQHGEIAWLGALTVPTTPSRRRIRSG